ncbi:MAG: sulfide/dihydroorotate dehydrogenase-like FAD/NAD-binding protein [Candidatus Omnitrophica bacterium]|nr:sulfide/dihydroorotate dehydrogenase-like FAD/NAD-binding protein [Candidatus Omnitrophota bacterium]
MIAILDKYPLAPHVYYMLLEAPLIAAKAQAGQFVIVRAAEEGERIPLTIADYDRTRGTVVLVFQETGKTTRLLASLHQGGTILDLLGPQGNPTEIERFGNTVVIGGGIGVAPIFPLARALREKGNTVTAIVGFRSREYVFWEEKMAQVSNRLVMTTNDGSYGTKGFVTDALKGLLDSGETIDRVFAIGPALMMKAVAEATKEKNIKTIVSLNSLMVCGMGMCGACRVTVEGVTRFTCMDGPDFDAHQVDFDVLIKRLETYTCEECGE